MNLSSALQPGAKVDSKTTWLITAGWLTFLLIFWCLTPPSMPKPPEVAESLFTEVTSGAFKQLIISIFLSLQAIFVASVIGLILAYLSAFALFRPPAKLVGWLRGLSLAGLIVLFLRMTTGHTLKVALLTFVIVVFLVTDMLQVIEDIPKEKYDYARTLGLSRWQILREVVIRGTLADAFESIRMNAAMAWMMLTMVEGLSQSEGGIGVLLLHLQRSVTISSIFAIQLMIFAVGIGQDWMIKGFKAAVCPYTVRK